MSPATFETREALENLLRWYVAMGVDAALDDAPHDRFAPPPDRSPTLVLPDATGPDDPPVRQARRGPDAADPLSSRPTAPEGPPASADALIRQAQALAASAGTIAALRDAWDGFQGCTLATTASRMIFAAGNPGATLMVLGAAPGSDDERQGEAFAGEAGQLIDGMLAAIGLSRRTVYLANVIPWRPPGNRPPTPARSGPLPAVHPAAHRLGRPSRDPLPGRARRTAHSRHEGKSGPSARALADIRGRRADGQDGRDLFAGLSAQPALQKKRAWIDLIAVAKMVEAEPRA